MNCQVVVYFKAMAGYVVALTVQVAKIVSHWLAVGGLSVISRVGTTEDHEFRIKCSKRF
jgi:hypothetical protein